MAKNKKVTYKILRSNNYNSVVIYGFDFAISLYNELATDPVLEDKIIKILEKLIEEHDRGSKTFE